MNKFEMLKHALNSKADPIGVKLIYDYDQTYKSNPELKELAKLHGYCEYVKRASQGESLILQKESFSCHTGNIMLGFKESNNIELTMRLTSRGLKYILLFPINKNQLDDYDSVILVLNPHNCMNIIEAYVRLYQKNCPAPTLFHNMYNKWQHVLH